MGANNKMAATYHDGEYAPDTFSLTRLAPRFWQKVKVGSPNECWPWGGATVGIGHGAFRSPAGYVASRYVWAVFNGRLPKDEEVIRHRCDNPPCCNPSHLEVGTQEQNVADMIDRGRAPYTRTTCRGGHERTPENTIIRPNGDRRCKICTRESQQKWKANRPQYACWHCGKSSHIYQLQRHLRQVHSESWSVHELRNRAEKSKEGG